MPPRWGLRIQQPLDYKDFAPDGANPRHLVAVVALRPLARVQRAFRMKVTAVASEPGALGRAAKHSTTCRSETRLPLEGCSAAVWFFSRSASRSAR